MESGRPQAEERSVFGVDLASERQLWRRCNNCRRRKLNLDRRNVQKRMMKGVRSSLSERVDMWETSVHISNNIVI